MDDILTNDALLKAPRRWGAGEGEEICTARKIQATPARDLMEANPCQQMKGTNVLLWEERTVTHFQFKQCLENASSNDWL